MKPVTNLKSIRGKNVLVRVDFNVPILKSSVHSRQFTVGDDTKIIAAVPTIEWLLKKGAKVVLMTHLGRPTSELRIKNEELRIIAERLGELLKNKVALIDKWDFEKIQAEAKKMKPGQLIMLPNLRLHPGEEKDSRTFAQELAGLGQIYVNEAFGVNHRAHASLVGVPKLLPAYAGLHLIKEVEVLGRLLHEPEKPLIVLMGGVKMSDKVTMIRTMVKQASAVLVGTALANNFFKAQGYGIGASLVDPGGVQVAKELLKNKKIVFPRDVVIGTTDGAGARVVEVPTTRPTKPYTLAPSPLGIWDIGPQTILEYAQYIKDARTLIWNGPLGLYEVKPYCHGTLALGRLFAARSRGKAFGVIGGGETIDAMKKTGMAEYVDFISTGGGAMLEFLGGKKLPGIEALYGSK